MVFSINKLCGGVDDRRIMMDPTGLKYEIDFSYPDREFVCDLSV